MILYMPYYRTKIKSGDVLEVEEHFSLRERDKRIPRRKGNRLPSSLRQMNLNDINSRKKLGRLINANFRKGDLWLRLSYNREPEFEQSIKDLRNFIRRVEYLRKKKGLPHLKYIAVTETEDENGEAVRIHHHIIMQQMNMEDIISLWPLGWVDPRRLFPGGDYEKLAKYMVKTARKAHAKRWSQSRYLERPIVEYQIVKRSPDVLKPPKGYIAIEQTYSATDNGIVKYLRAVRIGGADFR